MNTIDATMSSVLILALGVILITEILFQLNTITETLERIKMQKEAITRSDLLISTVALGAASLDNKTMTTLPSRVIKARLQNCTGNTCVYGSVITRVAISDKGIVWVRV